MTKTIVFAGLLLASVAAQAQSAWVRNNGNSVTLDVWNSSDRQLYCSGPIHLQLENGSTEYINVYEYVRPRGSLWRTYYPRTFGVRITRASSSIWCR